MEITEVRQDVQRGKLHSAYVIANFNEAKEVLRNENYQVISLEEQAGLRIREGADSGVSLRGNYTKEGVVYVPRKGIFLTRNSPIMKNAREATDCHRNRKEFSLSDEQLEEALESATEFRQIEIPTDRFADDELTVFAFGRNAEKYGTFLKDAGTASIQTFVADIKDKPFARQMWLRRFERDRRPILNGDGRGLHFNFNVVRGVRASTKSKKA